MERHFDEELTALKEDILRMGSMVESAITQSLDALARLDREEAKRIIATDNGIDALEVRIDETCLDLLALRQPMACDLRFIAMGTKITTDLERMADLAVDIAERVLEIPGQTLLKPLVDIPRLGTIARRMTQDALDSFVREDAQLAQAVIILDVEADRLRTLVQNELIEEYIAADRDAARRGVPLLLVARHLERICDHATNIAEDVIYMVKAKVVKHRSDNL